MIQLTNLNMIRTIMNINNRILCQYKEFKISGEITTPVIRKLYDITKLKLNKKFSIFICSLFDTKIIQLTNSNMIRTITNIQDY